jgi:hypothetical protein
MSWTVAEAGTGRAIQLTVGHGIEIVSQGQEMWYVARLPFETIAVDGLTFDPLPPDTFALSQSPVSFSRSIITVNGLNASLKAPAAPTFSLPEVGIAPPTHSRFERVDLELSTTYQALYDAWISAFFPLADPRSLPGADPDNDGFTNLMERALGLNPSLPSLSPVTTGRISVAGQSYFTFSYLQPLDAPDASLSAEITTDLQSWLSDEGS